MAVKVISKWPDPKVVKHATCGGCGAQLEFVPNDVERREGTDYGGGPYGTEWVVCPDCGKEVIIRSW